MPVKVIKLFQIETRQRVSMIYNQVLYDKKNLPVILSPFC